MFSFNDRIYSSEAEAMEAVMEAHPELGSDALVEYAETHIEELTYVPEEMEYSED